MTKLARRSARIITRAESERAIYIDFECLATEPPTPALLGVLDGDDDASFKQVLVHHGLVPGRTADKRRLTVGDLGDTVRALVETASVEERVIVGWSYFDREVASAAAPECEDALRTLYSNALHTARPWRSAMHPGFVVERAGNFAPKHTLDQYARLAAYPKWRKLLDAEPAHWIRHTLDQLKARRTLPGDDAPNEARLAQAARVQPTRLPRAAAHRPRGLPRARGLARV